MQKLPQYLTFDDVLLIPQYSEMLPKDANVASKISKGLKINIPLVSAAMDTVTEHEMAITMALEGGIGIIHKNLSPDQQAAEVKKVKRFENGFIRNPMVVGPDDKISKVIHIRDQFGYKAVPVTKDGEPNGELVGIVTKNDYMNKHASAVVKDRMTPFKKLFLAEKGISLKEAYEQLEESKYSKLLIVENKKNKKLFALLTRADLEKSEQYPNAAKDKNQSLICGAAVGPAKNMEERVKKVLEAGADLLVVDTAHGHSKGVIDTVKFIKRKYPKTQVVAGNVATAEAVKALIKAGADGVKVGIGPGSICTTRVVTGIGVPQLSAISECARAAQGKVPIIADGGVRYSGDVAKALAAGASAVMVGSLFAGTEESPGEIVYREGKTFKAYRGMGSIGAMRAGGRERYGQEGVKKDAKFVPEGIEGLTMYKGPVSREIYQLIGGLRSSMGYQGAKDLKTMVKKAKFIQITSASMKESHPHDVLIAREAPNYRT
jgi:IMP dehydrogenase